MGKRIDKLIYWAPRILSILFLCFLTLFSLDVISSELSIGQIAMGLFIHNIPVLILLVILFLSWKREIVGGIFFILAGVLYTGTILMNVFNHSFQWYMVSWILTIAGPALLIGMLFLRSWQIRKKERHGRS